MKKAFIYIFSFMVCSLMSCTGNTYSKLLKQEKKQIANYIERMNINVLSEEPQQYGTHDFYQVTGYDDLYFHLTQAGNTQTDSVKANDKIIIRYRKYSLNEYADTISNWNTAEAGYAREFNYYDTGNPNACTAWHIAVGLMKYSGAECRIICPSKLGFTEDNTNVTPYCYDLKMTIKRY